MPFIALIRSGFHAFPSPYTHWLWLFCHLNYSWSPRYIIGQTNGKADFFVFSSFFFVCFVPPLKCVPISALRLNFHDDLQGTGERERNFFLRFALFSNNFFLIFLLNLKFSSSFLQFFFLRCASRAPSQFFFLPLADRLVNHETCRMEKNSFDPHSELIIIVTWKHTTQLKFLFFSPPPKWTQRKNI